MKRKDMLEEAARIVKGAREDEYGGPEDSFGIISDLWFVYLSHKYPKANLKTLGSVDVAIMMDLMKTARLVRSPSHKDSWVDKAGYAACGCEIATRGQDGTE